MDDLRALCRQVGLDPSRVTHTEMIHERHGNRLYRIMCGRQSFVLKWFGIPEEATEVRSYALLEGLGVPTLPVHGRTGQALLLEDLLASPLWRLAREEDVDRPDVGTAVAEWYLAFHAAGREMLRGDARIPGFLGREVDALTGESIRAAGWQLELADNPVWALAAAHIEAIKAAMRSLSETLNDNDFHWTNLALSRQEPLRAIVFDYHLLVIGPAYCDCRNVAGSLGEGAARAFRDVYGPEDERERLLDEATAPLVALIAALRLPRFPRWAEGCLRTVKRGELEAGIRRALDVV